MKVMSWFFKSSFRVKSVDWIYLLATRFPEELTTHLKLFKQSRVRLKHVQLLSAKEMSNGTLRQSPKKQDDKKTHRRNKSETDLSWSPGYYCFIRLFIGDLFYCLLPLMSILNGYSRL